MQTSFLKFVAPARGIDSTLIERPPMLDPFSYGFSGNNDPARGKTRKMGMVTIHLVVGVGVLILPLCLILFSVGSDLGAGHLDLSNL